jgi:hypothetical protein
MSEYLWLNVALLLLCAISGVHAYVPPAPTWGACPAALSSLKAQQCSTITVPQQWDQTNDVTLNFVAAKFTPAHPNGVTMWYLGDLCLSNDAAFVIQQMNNQNFSVVQLFLRGTPQASPVFECTDQGSVLPNGWATPACGTELRSKKVDPSIYSISNTARDLDWALSHLGTGPNIILSDGLMTLLAQRLQYVDPTAGSGYVFAGVPAPDRFDIFGLLSGYESVAQRVFGYCEASNVCGSQAGGGQSLWDRWSAILNAAADGSLPCVQKLGWPTASYRSAFANIMAMLISSSSDPFTPTNSQTLSMIPAFIYRLQRCTPSDAAAINTLYEKLNSTANPKMGSGVCAASAAHRFNWLINEMVLSNPPPLAEILGMVSTYAVQQRTDFIEAVYAARGTWPNYTVSAEDRTYGGSPTPTVLLAAELDAVLSIGAAQYTTLQYTRNTQLFSQLNQIASQPLFQPGAGQCVVNAAIQLSHSTALPSSCPLSTLQFLDTNQNEAATQQYFGTTSMWSFTGPNPPIATLPPQIGPTGTPSPLHPPSPEPASSSASERRTALAFGLLFGLTWAGILAIFVYRRYKATSRNQDFYAQIQTYS